MDLYIKLFLVGLIPIALSSAFYFINKTKYFETLSYSVKQIIIGLVFGVAAIFGTVLGVDVGGATANARDAAPLCAGLLFGGPAGIISGIIGGLYRFFATYFGAGAYSQIACTVSTIVAGFFAAFLRKFMFENKRPTWAFGLATGVVMEVFHMTVLFLTHLDNSVQAIQIVKICTIPMVVCNSVSLTVSVLIIDIVSKSLKKRKFKYKKISQQIQVWLLLVVVLAYLATTSFVYVLQTGTAKVNAQTLMDTAITDTKNQINSSEISDLSLIPFNMHVGENGYVLIFDSEGNFVNSSLENNTDENNINFDKLGISNPDDFLTLNYFITNIQSENYFCKCIKYNDYYLLPVVSESEIYNDRDNSVYINSYMEVLVFAALFFIVYELIKRKVVDNIRIVNSSLSKIIDGDLSVMVNVKSSEEFFSLSNDINSTVETLKKYIDEAAKRIDSELAFAKNIQHSALPSVFPAYPSIKDFDIYATMFTAKEVGGDFYDFYLLDKSKLAFLIADVSGKGIPAAMFMMRAKTLIKSLSESGLPINDVFNIANNKLCEGNDTGMFVTAWMGVLDYSNGVLEFVNAGHNQPYIQSNNKFIKLSSKPGFILGGIQDINYKLNTIKLDKCSKLYLYTDGVIEASTKNNTLFGENKLSDFLNSNISLSCKDIILGVKQEVDLFVDGAEQFDDITMLCLEYKPNSNSFSKTFNVPNDDFSVVNTYLEDIFNKFNIDKKNKNKLLIACEEIFVNISKYAYENSGIVSIDVKNENNNIIIKFTDNGKQFNPLEKEEPNIDLSSDEREIGGLGIFMTKKMMDSTEYEYIENKNIFTITKIIK